jgi:hypothetical protein
LEAEYFAQRRKQGIASPAADPVREDEDNLLIYYFNNTEEPTEDF